MDVLIHPSYLPNIASFAAISQKKILWEVHDNYQKQTYRNRSYICTDQGRFMLSIPIIHKGKEQGRQLYKDVELENTSRWQRQHWRT
ncbi:MAG: WbqC family protein, partial [Eudoraea sp.]